MLYLPQKNVNKNSLQWRGFYLPMRIALSSTVIDDGGVVEEGVEEILFLCGESIFDSAAASEETHFWLPFVISWWLLMGWFSAAEDVDWINTGSLVRPILNMLRIDGVRTVFEVRERLRWVCLGMLYSCDKEFFKTFLLCIQCECGGTCAVRKSGWAKKYNVITFFWNWLDFVALSLQSPLYLHRGNGTNTLRGVSVLQLTRKVKVCLVWKEEFCRHLGPTWFRNLGIFGVFLR